MTTIELKKQIVATERQLDALRQELAIVETLEELDRQMKELERQREVANLELERFRAKATLDEVERRTSEIRGDEAPAGDQTDGQDDTQDEATDEAQDGLNSDTAKLVANVAKRIKSAATDEAAIDELIDRVKAEGTQAVRQLCAEFGLEYNPQYRRRIKKAATQKGGTKR